MAKSFVLMEKYGFKGRHEIKVIDALDKAQRDKAITDNWDFVKGAAPLLVEQDGGGNGGTDLTKIWKVVEELIENQELAATAFDLLANKVLALEEGGGSADFSTKQIPVEIYGGLVNGIPKIQNEGAIDFRPKYTECHISGNILTARFSISNGGLLNEGTYYIKPITTVSGYQAKNPTGLAVWLGARHGQIMHVRAEWKKYDTGWFIRMPLPNYDYMEARLGIDFGKYPPLPVRKVQIPGKEYLGKRCPVVAQNDTVLVQIPIFPT